MGRPRKSEPRTPETPAAIPAGPPIAIPLVEEPDTPADSPAIAPTFSPAEARNVYAVLGELEMIAAVKFLKVPPDVARQVFVYSSDELEQLAEPTATVLNKYVPAAVKDRKDELTLIFGLVAIHQAKFARLSALMSQMQQGPRPAPPGDPRAGGAAAA